jgi:hypothetical protein
MPTANYQLIQSVIGPNGTVMAIEYGYDANGVLEHEHPK